jgi:hypothetical protein
MDKSTLIRTSLTDRQSQDQSATDEMVAENLCRIERGGNENNAILADKPHPKRLSVFE